MTNKIRTSLIDLIFPCSSVDSVAIKIFFLSFLPCNSVCFRGKKKSSQLCAQSTAYTKFNIAPRTLIINKEASTETVNRFQRLSILVNTTSQP